MNCDYISGIEHVLTAYKDLVFNLCHFATLVVYHQAISIAF